MILGSPVSRKSKKHQQMIIPQNCVIKPPINPRTLSKKHHVESSPTPPFNGAAVKQAQVVIAKAIAPWTWNNEQKWEVQMGLGIWMYNENLVGT